MQELRYEPPNVLDSATDPEQVEPLQPANADEPLPPQTPYQSQSYYGDGRLLTPNHSSQRSRPHNVVSHSPNPNIADNHAGTGVMTPSTMSLSHARNTGQDEEGRQPHLEYYDRNIISSPLELQESRLDQRPPTTFQSALRFDNSPPSPVPLIEVESAMGSQPGEAGPADIHGRGQTVIPPAQDIPHWVLPALMNADDILPSTSQPNETRRPSLNGAISLADHSQGVDNGSIASFSCQTCSEKGIDKTFSKKTDLSKHERWHEERPFKCPHCNHWQRFAGHLNRHIKTHFEDRPYKCLTEDCEYKTKGFKRKDQLKRHLRQKHRLSEDGNHLSAQQIVRGVCLRATGNFTNGPQGSRMM